MTITESLDAFLTSLSVRVRPVTVRYYRSRLTHYAAHLDSLPATERTPGATEAYVAGRGWSGRTVAMLYGALRQWLRWSIERGEPIPDTITGLRAPKSRRKAQPPLTRAQITRLLDVVEGTWMAPAVALGALAGMAWGDIRVATWTPEDLSRGLLVYRRAKTGAEVRVPVTATLRAVLESVADGRVTVPVDSRNARRSLSRAYARAGIPPAPTGHNGWHRLRKAFGTALASRGADLSTIQALMGHAPGSAVTMLYMLSNEQQCRKAMERAFD